MKIKVLPDTVINQIAAGEVVERPASVVRELVDNAIDAGSTEVTVVVDNGGHSRIRVRDNGCGMTRDEAILAFERHATSKVANIEDLWHIGTLGFRGEALASIASVSKIRLTTRSREAEVGCMVVFRGGKLVQVESQAWPEGTDIEVEHLFFNTPARRKFLKSPRAELARIRTWLAHSSLSRWNVRYRLVADGTEILNLAPAVDMAGRARALLGEGLIPFRISEGGVTASGMVAHPSQALGDASGLIILVNGRLVSDKIVAKAVREGFDSMLKDREYPVGFVLIELPPEAVDVNVHPQKSEVRFRHPDQVFAVVRGGVLSAVRDIRGPMREVLHDRAEPAQSKAVDAESAIPAELVRVPQPYTVVNGGSETPRSATSRSLEWPIPMLPSAQPKLFVEEQGGEYAADGPAPLFRFSNLRYIGQLLECYLVCEHDEKLVVVDMHAAHERVNYNLIRKARFDRRVAVQRLLIPVSVTLTEEQAVRLLEEQALLAELGFEIEQESFDTVRITGVPQVVAHLNCVALVREIATEQLGEGMRERLEERLDHLAARLACHASIRSGDIVSREQVYALFAQLDSSELSAACPHGRPVVAEFRRDQVERWFGRDR